MSAAARSQDEASSSNAKTVIVLAVAGATGVAFLLALMPCRAMLRPLRACMEAVKALAAKDFSHTCRVKTHDEIGQMATAINGSIEAMRDAFHEIDVASQRDRELQRQREQDQQARGSPGVVERRPI
jgi:HAMP domain-containing protein